MPRVARSGPFRSARSGRACSGLRRPGLGSLTVSLFGLEFCQQGLEKYVEAFRHEVGRLELRNLRLELG